MLCIRSPELTHFLIARLCPLTNIYIRDVLYIFLSYTEGGRCGKAIISVLSDFHEWKAPSSWPALYCKNFLMMEMFCMCVIQ